MAKIQDLRGNTMGGNDKRSTIKKIARHHSATPTGNVYTFENHWKNTRGWNTGGYHEVILRDGTVQLCYDYNVVSNGVYGHNTTTYNICLVGDGSFTPEQEKAFDERAKYNLDRFNLSVNDLLGHNEFSGASTACPGIDMDKVRSRLKGGTMIKDQPKSEVKSTSKKKSTGPVADIQDTVNDRYGYNIAVDNIPGPETYKALLKAYQTELNNQFNAGLKVDGIWGPKTAAASVTVRKGAKGNLTWVLQAMLYCKGHKIKVDGVFGTKTENAVKAFQRSAGIAVDGVPGAVTFAKLFG